MSLRKTFSWITNLMAYTELIYTLEHVNFLNLHEMIPKDLLKSGSYILPCF